LRFVSERTKRRKNIPLLCLFYSFDCSKRNLIYEKSQGGMSKEKKADPGGGYKKKQCARTLHRRGIGLGKSREKWTEGGKGKGPELSGEGS